MPNITTQRFSERELTPSVIQRFKEKIVVDLVTGCWNWTAGKGVKGYGLFGLRSGKTVIAHRVMYTLYNGEIPFGMELHHVCENKRCVSPAHLELKTSFQHLSERKINPKKYCRNGHEFTEENTYYRLDAGREMHRQCIKCMREAKRRFRSKQ